MTVRKKIGLGFTTVGLMVVIILLVSRSQFNIASQNALEMDRQHLPRISATQEVLSHVWEQRASLYALLLNGEQQYVDDHNMLMMKSVHQWTIWLGLPGNNRKMNCFIRLIILMLNIIK